MPKGVLPLGCSPLASEVTSESSLHIECKKATPRICFPKECNEMGKARGETAAVDSRDETLANPISGAFGLEE
jgi:hypothetical protein